MNKITKKIGIIGGVGPQATMALYELIISVAQKKYAAKDNDDYPHLLIESVPIPDFISDQSQLSVAREMLQRTVARFKSAEVDCVAIASNTVHLLLPELQSKSGLEFISITELVANVCALRGYTRVGLLASSVTLASNLYDQPLAEKGIALDKPEGDNRVLIDQIIRHVLAGSDNSDTKIEYVNILNSLFDRGSEAIILGCTELPLAINYEGLGSKVLNSIEILAEGIVDHYYQK